MDHCFIKHSPVRNFKECYLYVNGKKEKSFLSVNEACRYASKKYNVSFSSLNRYRKVGIYEIIPKTQTTISLESTPEDRLLVEVPTTLTQQDEGEDIVQSTWKHVGS